MASVVAAQAKSMLWECVPNHTVQGGWITKKYFIRHDPATGKAVVLDEVIDYVKGGPIEAQVAKDDDRATVFRWTIRSPASDGSATMRYDATIIKATHEFRVNSTPVGYDNTENERGTCKLSK